MIAFTVTKPETQGLTRVRVLSFVGTREECSDHTVLRLKPEQLQEGRGFIITDFAVGTYRTSKTFYFVNVGIIGNILK